VSDAAAAFGVSERTVYRWLARYDAGEAMTDRSSAPHRRPRRTPAAVEAEIERLRRLRKTSTEIAALLGLATSTVCAVLVRLGLNRRWRLEPPEPPNRYCRRHPGELVHIDIKKLGRFARPGHRALGRGPDRHNRGVGWEFVYVAVDDTSRAAYVETLTDEKATTAVGFLDRALAWFAAHGAPVQRVMTDNGSPFVSAAWAARCRHHHVRHVRTRPYRPRTNGKAERFIQTLQREWAYARIYASSEHRRRALDPWVDYYNQRRPHSALGHTTPASRLHGN
jgi:transposase InsO family protein